MQRLEDNAALVIIDMPKGIEHPTLGRRNNPLAERRIESFEVRVSADAAYTFDHTDMTGSH